MRTSEHSPVIVSYARALLELAVAPANQAEAVGQELREIRQIIDEDKTFALYLADPGIGEIERGAVLSRVFKSRVNPLLWKFLGVLNAKGRLKSLVDISIAYDDLLQDHLGKIEVDVITAQKLDHDQLLQVHQKVSTALKLDAVVHSYVDESIIGGMILRVQDRLIDASVRQQLRSIRDRMLAGKPG